MTPVEYRAAARWYPEWPVRQAHQVEQPEPLWLAVAVYLVGIPLIAVIVLFALGGPG